MMTTQFVEDNLQGLTEQEAQWFWTAFLTRCDVSCETRDQVCMPPELRGHRWAVWWWAGLSECYDYPLRTGLGILFSGIELMRAVMKLVGC